MDARVDGTAENKGSLLSPLSGYASFSTRVFPLFCFIISWRCRYIITRSEDLNVARQIYLELNIYIYLLSAFASELTVSANPLSGGCFFSLASIRNFRYERNGCYLPPQPFVSVIFASCSTPPPPPRLFLTSISLWRRSREYAGRNRVTNLSKTQHLSISLRTKKKGERREKREISSSRVEFFLSNCVLPYEREREVERRMLSILTRFFWNRGKSFPPIVSPNLCRKNIEHRFDSRPVECLFRSSLSLSMCTHVCTLIWRAHIR